MKHFNISNLRNNGSLKRDARKPMPLALAAGMALISVHSSAFADAIPATFYACRGLDLTVKYNTGAIGELSLSVARGGKPIVKRGDEVRVQGAWFAGHDRGKKRARRVHPDIHPSCARRECTER